MIDIIDKTKLKMFVMNKCDDFEDDELNENCNEIIKYLTENDITVKTTDIVKMSADNVYNSMFKTNDKKTKTLINLYNDFETVYEMFGYNTLKNVLNNKIKNNLDKIFMKKLDQSISTTKSIYEYYLIFEKSTQICKKIHPTMVNKYMGNFLECTNNVCFENLHLCINKFSESIIETITEKYFIEAVNGYYNDYSRDFKEWDIDFGCNDCTIEDYFKYFGKSTTSMNYMSLLCIKKIIWLIDNVKYCKNDINLTLDCLNSIMCEIFYALKTFEVCKNNIILNELNILINKYYNLYNNNIKSLTKIHLLNFYSLIHFFKNNIELVEYFSSSFKFTSHVYNPPTHLKHPIIAYNNVHYFTDYLLLVTGNKKMIDYVFNSNDKKTNILNLLQKGFVIFPCFENDLSMVKKWNNLNIGDSFDMYARFLNIYSILGINNANMEVNKEKNECDIQTGEFEKNINCYNFDITQKIGILCGYQSGICVIEICSDKCDIFSNITNNRIILPYDHNRMKNWYSTDISSIWNLEYGCIKIIANNGYITIPFNSADDININVCNESINDSILKLIGLYFKHNKKEMKIRNVKKINLRNMPTDFVTNLTVYKRIIKNLNSADFIKNPNIVTFILNHFKKYKNIKTIPYVFLKNCHRDSICNRFWDFTTMFESLFDEKERYNISKHLIKKNVYDIYDIITYSPYNEDIDEYTDKYTDEEKIRHLSIDLKTSHTCYECVTIDDIYYKDHSKHNNKRFHKFKISDSSKDIYFVPNIYSICEYLQIHKKRSYGQQSQYISARVINACIKWDVDDTEDIREYVDEIDYDNSVKNAIWLEVTKTKDSLWKKKYTKIDIPNFFDPNMDFFKKDRSFEMLVSDKIIQSDWIDESEDDF